MDVDNIRVSVPPGPDFQGVLRLVVGGIGSRSHLSFDQVDELQLALNVLFARRRVAGDAVILQVQVEATTVVALVGPFSPEEDGGAGRVLAPLVDGVRSVADGELEWVELTVRGRVPVAGGIS